MREVELVFLEIDPHRIMVSLEKMGAQRVFDGDMIAEYFDFKDGRLAKKDSKIRLRKEGEITELALKNRRKSKQAKIYDEEKVYVSDMETTRKILLELSLQEIRRIAFHRISFIVAETRFEIDTIPGIPTYLEIESTTIRKIQEYAALLGLSMGDGKKWSKNQIQEFYKKKRQ